MWILPNRAAARRVGQSPLSRSPLDFRRTEVSTITRSGDDGDCGDGDWSGCTARIIAEVVRTSTAICLVGATRSATDTNPLAVSLALQLAGIGGAAIWATLRSEWHAVLSVVTSWWWIPLGVGGWLVVAALGFAADRVGVATRLAVSIGAQMAAALVMAR